MCTIKLSRMVNFQLLFALLNCLCAFIKQTYTCTHTRTYTFTHTREKKRMRCKFDSAHLNWDWCLVVYLTRPELHVKIGYTKIITGKSAHITCIKHPITSISLYDGRKSFARKKEIMNSVVCRLVQTVCMCTT